MMRYPAKRGAAERIRKPVPPSETVIFRVYTRGPGGGATVAVFPEVPAGDDPSKCHAWSPSDGEIAVDYGRLLKYTRPATTNEVRVMRRLIGVRGGLGFRLYVRKTAPSTADATRRGRVH